MAAEAARRLRKLRAAHVHVLVSDAQRLGFGLGSFDAVLCTSALHLIADPQAALHEFHRVLAPGGAVGVTLFGADDYPRWKTELLRRCCPHQVDQHDQENDANDLACMLPPAGFPTHRIDRQPIDVRFLDPDER